MRKILQKFCAYLLTICMMAILLPMDVSAAPETATVEDVYATGYEGDNPTGLTFTQGADGESPIAVFIYGAEYTISNDCSSKSVAVNNVSVTVDTEHGGSININELLLFGPNASLTVAGVTFTSRVNALSVNTADILFQHIGDTDARTPSASGTVSNTLNVPADTNFYINGSLSVGSGGTLTVESGGKIIIPDNGSLAVTGSISPSNGSIIQVGANATVSGVTLYDNQGTNVISYDGSDDSLGVFIYNTDAESGPVNKWLREENAPTPTPAIPNNKYVVEYDNMYDNESHVATAAVMEGNTTIVPFDNGNPNNTDAQNAFIADTTLELTLHPQASRYSDTPIVEVELSDGNRISSNSGDNSNPITLTTIAETHITTVSYTPGSSAGFKIRVWWSAFDAFSPDAGEFMVRTDADSDGTISLSPSPAAGKFISHEGEGTRSIYNNGTSVTAIFTPNSQKVLSEVTIGQIRYNSNPGEGEQNLSTLQYDSNYTYTFNSSGGNGELYIGARFDDATLPSTNRFQIMGVGQNFSINEEHTNQLVYNNGSVTVTYGTSNTVPALHMASEHTDQTDEFNIGEATSIHFAFTTNDNCTPKLSIDGQDQTITGNAFTYTLQQNETFKCFNIYFNTNTPNPPTPPAGTDGIEISFVDMFGNAWSYENYKTNTECAALATIIYSYDGSTNWNEFTTAQVSADNNLNYSIRSINGVDTPVYSFVDTVEHVYLKVTVVSGAINNEILNNVGNEGQPEPGPLTINQSYELVRGNVYNLKNDRNIRTLIWNVNDSQQDMRLEHGRVRVMSATLNGEDALIHSGVYTQATDGSSGHIGIKPGATVVIQLLPDYGYQLETFALNGAPLSPQETIGTFSFVMANANLHLSAIFAEGQDEVNTLATNISGATISNAAAAVSSGNIRMTVEDSAYNETQITALTNSTAAANVTIDQYIDVNLKQFVKKGTNAEWVVNLTELSNNISISLNVGTGLDTSRDYVVIREHNGVYTRIPATYNAAAGTLTFASNCFSDYAIGSTPHVETQPQPQTQTQTQAPTPTPVQSKVTITEVKTKSQIVDNIPIPITCSTSLQGAAAKVAEQGEACKMAFALGTPKGYEEAFTFNLVSGDKVTQDEKTGNFSFDLPEYLIKEGRSFALVGVDKNGKPVTFKDKNADKKSITINLAGFEGYAFSLVFSDTPIKQSKSIPTSRLGNDESGDYYIVQRGDSMGKIARKLEISLDDLIRSNNIANPNKIRAGQKIYYN